MTKFESMKSMEKLLKTAPATEGKKIRNRFFCICITDIRSPYPNTSELHSIISKAIEMLASQHRESKTYILASPCRPDAYAEKQKKAVENLRYFARTGSDPTSHTANIRAPTLIFFGLRQKTETTTDYFDSLDEPRYMRRNPNDLGFTSWKLTFKAMMTRYSPRCAISLPTSPKKILQLAIETEFTMTMKLEMSIATIDPCQNTNHDVTDYNHNQLITVTQKQKIAGPVILETSLLTKPTKPSSHRSKKTRNTTNNGDAR